MQIRAATADDTDAMLALFPRLSDFPIPENRNPVHLWRGDADMLKDWAKGGRDDCLVFVAEDDDGTLLGLAMVTLRPELLSSNDSSHLEAIVVAKQAEGRGIGARLMEAAEQGALAAGARSMSLHVFANNQRARRVYERCGFDGELVRYIKSFSDDALE